MASTSETMRPLKRSTRPLVCGVRGLIWRYAAPSSAQTLAKAWVKQLPLSVNTCVMRKGKAAAASRRKAMALASVSSSLTARWTERGRRSMGPPWTLTTFVLTFAMWWVMMLGMMVPSATPMVLTFAALNRSKRRRGQDVVPTSIFLFGYLIAWGLFSIIATLA